MKNNFDANSLWIKDSLDLLRNINSECVDLIYLDPPDRPKHRGILPLLTSYEKITGSAYPWVANDIDIYELEEMAEQNPKVHKIIKKAPDRETQAYLALLAKRLFECHRILQPTGSVYLHCSEGDAPFLKMLMDAIFGKKNFLDSIEWRRSVSYRKAQKRKPAVDCLLFYAKMEGEHFWAGPRHPRSDAEIRLRYPHTDPNKGRFSYEPITGRGAIKGEEHSKSWKGYDIAEIGKRWSPPAAGPYADYLDLIIPDYKAMDIHAKLNALDQAELIGHFPNSVEPKLKRLAEADLGKTPQGAVWDTPKMKSFAASLENQGYPSQKPVALLARIIHNSSKPGNVVLDAFSGSGTTFVAASRLDRLCVGCDANSVAGEIFQKRMDEELGLFSDSFNILADLPARNDTGTLPNYRKHRLRLYGEQKGICAGCGEHFKFEEMSVDHKVPVSKGRNDHPNNLQLMCVKCNSSKKDLTMAEWKAQQSVGGAS